MRPKHWKVVETFIPAFSLWAVKFGHYELAERPRVTERFYRWRWTAVLSAFNTNSFSAFNPALVRIFGLTIARVERVAD